FYSGSDYRVHEMTQQGVHVKTFGIATSVSSLFSLFSLFCLFSPLYFFITASRTKYRNNVSEISVFLSA
ncbi:MAG: hypothetical protein ACK559_37570, partial [bacterium]